MITVLTFVGAATVTYIGMLLLVEIVEDITEASNGKDIRSSNNR